MSNAPTTQPIAPTRRSSSRSRNSDRCLCMDVNGRWKKVAAPWVDYYDPEVWWVNNAGDLVFTSRRENERPSSKPSLMVYEIEGTDPNHPETKHIGIFQGMIDPRNEATFGCVQLYFLLEPLALPKLVAEFAPLLNHHPAVPRSQSATLPRSR